MKSDTVLDYAVFQLSPRRSRCELFVSSDGKTEKLASGLVKPFVTHLKVAEEQVALSVQSIKLEFERWRHAEKWFTKGTLERFVRFVSTPEILELVNTFDAEMSQLEAAQRLYSQGMGDQLSGAGGVGSGTMGASDATKKELLRAIDVRLSAVKQDLNAAFTRAAAAGFNLETVSELQIFADRFGAHRLKEACGKFQSLCERRPVLVTPVKTGADDCAVRSSYGSDMSIDEDSTTPDQRHAGSHQQSNNNNTVQPKASITFPSDQNSEPSVEREDASKGNVAVAEDEKKDDSSFKQVEAIPDVQPTRRLSVKDRINLFENQKKESPGGGAKPVVGKSVELRRQSSDAPEKSVLRRWSGASDMSIDLGGEKKEVDSPLCTPSASASQVKFEELGGPNSSNLAGPFEQSKNVPGRVVDSGLRDRVEDQLQVQISSSRDEVVGARQFMCSSTKLDDVLDTNNSSFSSGIRNQAEDKSQTYYKTQIGPSSSSNPANLNQEISRDPRGRANSETRLAELKDQGADLSHSEGSKCKGEYFAFDGHSNQAGRVEVRSPTEELQYEDQLPSHSHGKFSLKTGVDSRQTECGSALRSRGSFASQIKGSEDDSTIYQPKFRSFPGTEEDQKILLASSPKLTGNSALSMDDSRTQRIKFEKKVSDPEQLKRAPGRNDESNYAYGNRKTLLAGKTALQPPEGSDSFPTPPASLVQRTRQSKGNQELDELKMKANELEKLFTEHKLRVPADSSSSQKSRDMQLDPSYRESIADDSLSQSTNHHKSMEPARHSNYVDDFATPPIKIVQNRSGGSLIKSFSELGVSEGSRGKLYDRYMQKRNEKLTEEWSSRKAEKEAKLKTMHEIFERSRAEIEAKFIRSTDGKVSASNARQRAERLRSFNTHSHVGKEQQGLDFGQSDDDENVPDFQVQNYFAKDRSLGDTFLSDDLTSSSANKKLLPSKSLSSSTPRTSAAPIPRSASKASNVGSGRRKVQSDNPLAQSVPNFTEMKKENPKSQSAAGKTSRPQVRNYARSKSADEEASIVKEEKPRRSQSLRKSYVNPTEFTATSPVIPEETEQGSYDRFQELIDTQYLAKKGSGRDFSSRTSFAKPKPLLSLVTMNNGEDNDDVNLAPDSADILNDKGVEAIANESHENTEDREPWFSHDSEKMINSGSENGDAVRSFSHGDPSMSVKFPAGSSFHAVEHMHDSPVESPIVWNLRGQDPFSYPQEMSDVDASADSPVGSPVSWNSHSLSQMESDAARMRKKWGTAQKPMLITNTSNSQSRKDMTSGFKRLLKFGRKSRGTENLADWISATTSEGDDDTEDVRDPANRLSDDLRKSRMGLSQGHPSDDSFNDNEFSNEQVQSLHSSIPAPPPNFKVREDHLAGSSIKAPRSFFSLTTFRSKGSDSKPR